jgi:rhodanese-related sulfurtransferase
MEFILKNWALVLIAAVSGGMLLWPLARRSAGGPWVSTLQATQLMNREDALVVDLRPAAEFAQGHILGARNIPLADLARRAGELDRFKAKPVIVHCASGNSSGAGVALLRGKGFGNVVNLAGGYSAWQQAGLPVEKK